MKASAKTSYITVNKGITTVTTPAVKNKYKATAYFNVTVYNKAINKPISGLSLIIKIYTGKKYVKYVVKTNSSGVAVLNTNKITKRVHNVVITSGNSRCTISESVKFITTVN